MKSRNDIRNVAALILLAFLAIIAFVNSGNESHIRNFPSIGTDIIVFGDSLVAGVGATSRDTNFVSILAKKIGKPVINMGISGNTTADGLARLSTIDRYNPKIVILVLGGNDFIRKVSPDETFRNLASIIEGLQMRGAIVILVGVRDGIISDRYATRFKDLSERYETEYVPDILDGLMLDSRYMSDAIHPNDAGYRKIADKIYPVLLRLDR